MKILLLADIHANWPALSAIRETFDVCLFLGDVVDYATDPLPCIEWVRKYAHACVRGNHDHSVAQRVLVRPGGTFRRMAAAMRPQHFEVLGDEHLTWLAQMPVTRHLTLGDHRFLLVHATPRDPMDEYIGDNVEHWQQRLEHVDVDFVCVGHTHTQFCLQLKHTRVLNPGSVGLSRDGDPRARYAVIENGEVTLKQVEYPIEETVKALEAWNIDAKAKAMLADVYRTGRYVPPASTPTEEP